MSGENVECDIYGGCSGPSRFYRVKGLDRADSFLYVHSADTGRCQGAPPRGVSMARSGLTGRTKVQGHETGKSGHCIRFELLNLRHQCNYRLVPTNDTI